MSEVNGTPPAPSRVIVLEFAPDGTFSVTLGEGLRPQDPLTAAAWLDEYGRQMIRNALRQAMAPRVLGARTMPHG